MCLGLSSGTAGKLLWDSPELGERESRECMPVRVMFMIHITREGRGDGGGGERENESPELKSSGDTTLRLGESACESRGEGRTLTGRRAFARPKKWLKRRRLVS